MGGKFLVMGRICWLEPYNVRLLVSRLADCAQPLHLVITTVSLRLSFVFYYFWRSGFPSRLTLGPHLRELLAELVISIIDGKPEVVCFKNIFKSPFSEAVGRTTRF